MARDHVRIQLSINTDIEFCALPADAQLLYFKLMAHQSLTYCGVADWRPGRLSALVVDWDAPRVIAAAEILRQRLYVVIDETTEEVLIRSFIRRDGLLEQHRMPVSMAKAYSGTASLKLRGVVIHELHRMHEEFPAYKAWELPAVREIMQDPSIDPTELCHSETQSYGIAEPDAMAYARGGPHPVAMTPPTPAPAPATYSSSLAPPASQTTGRRRAPERPLPDDWTPKSSHYEKAKPGIDINAEAETFRNHALSIDRRLRNWDSGFDNWIAKARPSGTVRPSATDAKVAQADQAVRNLEARAGQITGEPFRQIEAS